MSRESVPSDIPAEAVGFLKEMGYFEPDRIAVGDSIVPITLARLDGGFPVTIGAASDRPVVLIFGSFT